MQCMAWEGSLSFCWIMRYNKARGRQWRRREDNLFRFKLLLVLPGSGDEVSGLDDRR